MLKLNQTLEAFDVAEALQHETGLFRVQSPGGERYQVTCQPGASISSFVQAAQAKGKGAQAQVEPWTITKIAEIRTEALSG